MNFRFDRFGKPFCFVWGSILDRLDRGSMVLSIAITALTAMSLCNSRTSANNDEDIVDTSHAYKVARPHSSSDRNEAVFKFFNSFLLISGMGRISIPPLMPQIVLEIFFIFEI